MKKLLLATAMLAALVGGANANDGTYLYMCKTGREVHPVTVNLIQDKLIWLGRAYTHVTDSDDCKVKYTATRASATISLCTATQGVAALTDESGAEFDCQMPGSRDYQKWLRSK
jgi:hypothetical protein